MIKLLTGNDLPTGDVVWWTGFAWSRHLRDAVPVDPADPILAQTIEAERINDPTLIDAEPGNPPAPRTAREKIRGVGPSVRPDLARA